MERKDVMSKNVAIYKAQAAALEAGAAPGCKVRAGGVGRLAGRQPATPGAPAVPALGRGHACRPGRCCPLSTLPSPVCPPAI